MIFLMKFKDAFHPKSLRLAFQKLSRARQPMKCNPTHIAVSALSLSFLSSVFAGEDDLTYIPPEDSPTPIPTSDGGPNAFKWLTPSVDIRTRFEYREIDGQDPSTSVTARGRLGLTLGNFNGFSAFGEIEATTAIHDDFTVGQPNISPNDPNQTPIADPESAEINRAWLQYKKDGILLKGGRQRIIRNDAFHIGNVGWRQNEQTFDAAQIGYTKDDFNISYVYSWRAQRIFGSDALGAAAEFTGDFHLIDLSYDAEIGKLGAYAYLIDVDNNAAVGESNSFGIFGDFGPLYLEFAYQEGDSSLANGDYDAVSARGHYTLKTDYGNFAVGADWTQEDFKTPFQTAHAHFGFADAFLAQQVGLNEANGFDGIFDGYLKYTKTGLPGGITFKAHLHYFTNDSLDSPYGYEIDAVLVKKFTDNLTGLIKGAFFQADGGSEFSDINQITVDLSYKY